MIVVLRPVGRGNWKPIYVTIEGGRDPVRPLDFHVGQLVELAARRFRVVRINP